VGHTHQPFLVNEVAANLRGHAAHRVFNFVQLHTSGKCGLQFRHHSMDSEVFGIDRREVDLLPGVPP
jgi:hypothetical protein